MSYLEACRHFGTCGGCRFQHVPYEEQLAQKQNYIEELFLPFSATQLPIIPCPSPWRYRNKMEFSFSQTLSGEQFLGLMMKGRRRDVFTIGECLLAPEWFMEAVSSVRIWWKNNQIPAYYPPKDYGSLRTLTLREGVRTKERMAVLTVSGNPEFALGKAAEEELAQALKEVPVDSILLREQVIARKTTTRFIETCLHGKPWIHEILYDLEGKELQFRIGGDTFFQPNTLQTERLYHEALLLSQLKKNDVIFDLYCGVGTIGMVAAASCSQVVGVEENPVSVSNGRHNLVLNRISNMEIHQGDVGAVLSEHFVRPDLVLADPPRAGISPQAMHQLAALSPDTIAYISCNPATLAKNCNAFVELGYQLEILQPVDQFPHTPHIETIALLKKVALS